MSGGPVHEHEIRQLAAETTSVADEPLTELMPQGTVRSFRAGGDLLRVDMDPNSRELEAEALALDALASATARPIAADLKGAGAAPLGGADRRWLVYEFVAGHTMSRDEVGARAREVGELFATLHGARVFDLRERFPARGPMTLMESFKRTTDRLRAWTLAREDDGLGQDLLTLTLSDVQRAMREHAMALDHAFLAARRRVLCHGNPRPEHVIARDDGTLSLVGMHGAHLGDPSEDLAAFSVAADLTEAEEDALLGGYLDHLEALGRADPRFLTRFFARRVLGLLAAPVARLDRLRRIKTREIDTFEDPVVAIEREAERTYTDLVRAINGLRALAGPPRGVSEDEVRAMGQLLAYEELVLEGRVFRIAVTGLPYAGKTEVGSALARRLRHRYVNSVAIGRAFAVVENRAKEAGEGELEPAALVERTFALGLEMSPQVEPPYYRVLLDGDDVTREVRARAAQARGMELLADEAVRAELRRQLTRHYAADGVVVEGPWAHNLIEGQSRCFHLTCERSVRLARLKDHRHEVDDETAESSLDELDARAPAAPEDAMPVDLGSRPAAAAARDVIWQLLPPNRRPQGDSTDLTGPVFDDDDAPLPIADLVALPAVAGREVTLQFASPFEAYLTLDGRRLSEHHDDDERRLLTWLGRRTPELMRALDLDLAIRAVLTDAGVVVTDAVQMETQTFLDHARLRQRLSSAHVELPTFAVLGAVPNKAELMQRLRGMFAAGTSVEVRVEEERQAKTRRVVHVGR
jgi:cytidylate kinase